MHGGGAEFDSGGRAGPCHDGNPMGTFHFDSPVISGASSRFFLGPGTPPIFAHLVSILYHKLGLAFEPRSNQHPMWAVVSAGRMTMPSGAFSIMEA